MNVERDSDIKLVLEVKIEYEDEDDWMRTRTIG